MEDKKLETEKTKKYMEEMKDIIGRISNFLDKYTNPNNLRKDFSGFKGNLKKVIDTLIIRIDSEELDMFFYWSL